MTDRAQATDETVLLAAGPPTDDWAEGDLSRADEAEMLAWLDRGGETW